MTTTQQQYPDWEHKLCYSCKGSGHSFSGWDLGTCYSCKGGGSYWVHKPTGIRAEYPGGRFV